jgi:sec-independent protein translocase protein TatC
LNYRVDNTMSETPVTPTMTFWEHLEELRSRLIKCIVAVAIGVAVAWLYKQPLLAWLTRPFVLAWQSDQLGAKATLHFGSPAALFMAYVKLSFIGGCVFALPVVLYQLWSFIAPGLYSREKRLAIPFVVSSCGLFAAGGWFGWRVAFPVAFRYLLGFSGQVSDSALSLTPTVMIDDYLSFVGRMLIAFGLVFELPIVVFFLTVAGLINHHHLIRYARHFIVVAFLVAAIVTPPDVVSQLLLAIPLCVLYAVSIAVAWAVSRKGDPQAHG